MEINKHIVDNLDYYLKLSSPEYAFLLCGDWGVGKTHFIGEFVENKKNTDLKLIKISLFGLKNISDINACIFQELHPILGSKYARLAGNVLKGAISMGVKLDVDSDGTSESTLNTKLDKLDIREFFSDKKTKEIVLIFDDLERSEISTVEVLGFINALVENSKVKVILIANENAIVDGDDGKTYTDFKEKVIGKTFEIKHDFDTVLSHFLDGYSLINYKQSITDVYKRSKLKNLRKFKQSIDDFEYLINKVDDKYKENNQFYKDLVRCFFALSIEIKKGNLSEKDLRKNVPFRWSAENKKTSGDVYTKYFDGQTHLYNGDTWANILFKGDLAEINEETSKLAFFVEKIVEERPDWVKLWNFRELDETEFSKLIESLESELNDLVENNLKIYLHKISLIIYFSKNSLSKISMEHVHELVKDYISEYKASEHWKNTSLSNGGMFDGTGYGYLCDRDDDFINLKKLIVDSSVEAFEQGEIERKKEKVDLALNVIKTSNLESFSEILLGEYSLKPIFNGVEPRVFIDRLLDSDNSTIGKITDVLSKRYTENHIYNGAPSYSYLKSEIDFWIGVQQEINELLPYKQMLKGHLLGLFSKYTITNIINLLSK
ncbi:P-loop NTPase fold protein [Aliivibrio fischeri]|uniref:P-loop NTPase fold protein n=1 Tax=Aliivibrio fischeri TaxID=668 RepID=UPI0012DA6905|nr:P-loop NTPase fold protein [Aliivibrio fischeri]MUL10417.1 hypothetical protein [Aliivibrio fischeri]MUL12556.1 hypothetical protein [Aliivibrio fischeri]